MTVRELIKSLKGYSPNMKVITDRHSEYAEVNNVRPQVAYENGGYVSEARTPEQKLRAHGFVHIS